MILVKIYNNKSQTFAIEIQKTTLNVLKQYIQDLDIVTAEEAILRLLEKIKEGKD